MVLSFLMLVAFTVRWLYRQYGEERLSLQQKLKTAYEALVQYRFDEAFGAQYLPKSSLLQKPGVTHNFRIIADDSIENMPESLKEIIADKKKPSVLLKQKIKRDGTLRAHSGASFNDTFINSNDSKLHPSIANKHSNIAINISDNAAHADSTSFLIQDLSSSSGSDIDTGQIKVALINMLTGFGKNIFPLKIDSVALKKDIDSVMRKEYAGIPYHFTEARHHELSIATPKNNNNLYFTIYSYRWFLIKKMIPQIGFCFVLLVLCSFAFFLSYFTIRKQIRLSEQKNDFISNMSHELKTPVTTAQLALEAFNHFDMISNTQKTNDYLHIAQWEMKRLEMLVANVLNNARLEEGRISFQKEIIALDELLQQLLLQFAPICQEQHKQIIFDNSTGQLKVFADKLHLQGAFYNIIDNAVKYGQQKINIIVTATSSHILVNISDDGEGIPAQYRRKIFDKFFRIPHGNEHLVKGYGLGLHYTKYVIEEHSGKIEVQDAPSGGAAVLISLPKERSNEN